MTAENQFTQGAAIYWILVASNRNKVFRGGNFVLHDRRRIPFFRIEGKTHS
jgi:hypothetical protein